MISEQWGVSDGAHMPQRSPVEKSCLFGELSMAQMPDAPERFRRLFEAMEADGTHITTVIELGTAGGGLTSLLGVCMRRIGNSEVHTFDVQDAVPKPIVLAALGVHRHFGSVFETPMRQGIEWLIASSTGSVLLLCDNGDKPREFQMFAPYLREGDVIMAHDYMRDLDTFVMNFLGLRWNWMEIQERDIAATCVAHNLEPYHEDITTPMAWCCRRKESA